MDNLNAAFEPVRAVWRKGNWPGVVESLSYGTPSLKFKGKLLLRLREPGVVVITCGLDEKEILIKALPDVYFQTDHYKNSPAVLAHLDLIAAEELQKRIEKAWRSVASKRMLADYDKRRGKA